MISSISLAKLFLNQSSTFQVFLSNHEKFSFYNCFSFITKAKISRSNLKHFRARMTSVNVPVTNAMIGVVEWPYIHNQWDTKTRLNAIASHYEVLDKRLPDLMDIHLDKMLPLFQFDERYENISVILDRPNWFIREGEIVINLVQKDLRIASIAFTLSQKAGKVIAYLGAVQGIHSGISTDQSLETYKRLTKLFYGLRPKTLLLEILKSYLKLLGVSQFYGVADQHRHHRHKYFGFNQNSYFKSDYNLFWEEHGGYLNQRTGFYQLDMKPAIREIDTIPSKKRSQYKKRNALVASLDAYLISDE